MPDGPMSKAVAASHPPARAKFKDPLVSIADIAAYLGYSVAHTRKRVIVQPSFPRRIGLTGHPRWLQSEVEAWVRSARESRRIRHY